jgi:hypothetical protein
MPDEANMEPHLQQFTPSDSSQFSLFLRIGEIWGLNAEQQITLIGSPARSTFFKWKKNGPSMSADTVERISHLTAIFKDLGILFDTPWAGDRWLRAPNKIFEGLSALDVMLEGRLVDIIRVRQYLDAQRGG